MLDEPTLLGAVVLGALILYLLFGGADFGGGVWHLLATGPRAGRQRALVAQAIAPIWEANHVWLILVVVILFTGFPPAFAAFTTRLHAPLLALLLAIVARGAAFAFRSASGDRARERRGWSAVFIAGSLAAPVLLGMIVAAVASGDVGTDGAPLALSWRGPWLTPFALAAGPFALALCAFLAAVYLTVEAEGASDRPLADDFRLRAVAAGVLCGALALLTFLLSADSAPRLHAGLSVRRWSWPLHLLTGLAAFGALVAIVGRRSRLARGLAAAQVALVVLGWGVSQYPYLMPPYLTLRSASAPPETQTLLLIALGAGALVLFPSLRLLFRVFKARPR
ncbi:MAG TPA: cytochrome d ubiquinol oxidase subunit II [Polyangia bacterium]|nr:cytochrome d ubiquinol oxidase subunit II [Polyangia bacterium]